MLSARTGAGYAGGNVNVGTFGGAVGFGYVAPLSGRWALIPQVEIGGFSTIGPTTSASVGIVEPLAVLAVPYFLGDNGFIEPFGSVGGAIAFGNGTSAGTVLLTLGYRLGVVF
jgi:hypothetical protein